MKSYLGIQFNARFDSSKMVFFPSRGNLNDFPIAASTNHLDSGNSWHDQVQRLATKAFFQLICIQVLQGLIICSEREFILPCRY